MKRSLLLLAVLAGCSAVDPNGAMAQQCGLWGNRPEMLGGCTVNDSTGRPAVRITEPYPGTGYRSQPVPGYRPVNPVPSPYIGKPYGWTR
jgi:hypothetical protein